MCGQVALYAPLLQCWMRMLQVVCRGSDLSARSSFESTKLWLTRFFEPDAGSGVRHPPHMDNTENGAGFSTSTIMTNDGRRSPVVSPMPSQLLRWLLLSVTHPGSRPGYCLATAWPRSVDGADLVVPGITDNAGEGASTIDVRCCVLRCPMLR